MPRATGGFRVPLALALVAPLAFGSLACNLIVDTNRVQCVIDADCAVRGGAFADSVCLDSICQSDPKWACLSKPATPSTQPPPYRVGISLRNLVTQQAIAEAQVRLCRKIDVDCVTPVGMAISDAAGELSFLLEANFAGYLEIQAAGLLPTLYFFNPTIDHDEVIPAISLTNAAANAGLLLQLGQQMSPNHGNVVIQSHDCVGASASGIRYSTPDGDTATVTFYLVGGLPTTTAMETDSAGYGGLLNVPTGSVTVAASLVSPTVSLETISLLVRDAAITYSRVVPIGK